jgi:hypothetical protein
MSPSGHSRPRPAKQDAHKGPLHPESGQMGRRLAKSALCRFCCKSRKLPGDNFPAITRTNRRPPLCVASITLPRSPVSLSSGDEIPHIFTRKSRLQPGEFLITSAKRLLQQNRHKVDIPRRSAVCPLLGVKRTWDFARSRSSPPLVTRMRHQKRIFAVMHNSAIW